MRCVVLWCLVMLATLLSPPSGARAVSTDPGARPPSLAIVDANARAEGNRRAAAVALGSVLLRRVWPAQIMKVRVDGVGQHEVAGLVLSGVKFRGHIDCRTFGDEVVALIDESLAAIPVEEVDVWVTTPRSVAKGTPVAGDNAQPTSRIVFGLTVRRNEAPALRSRLASAGDSYWNTAWKKSLAAARSRTRLPVRGAARPGPAWHLGVANGA